MSELTPEERAAAEARIKAIGDEITTLLQAPLAPSELGDSASDPSVAWMRRVQQFARLQLELNDLLLSLGEISAYEAAKQALNICEQIKKNDEFISDLSRTPSLGELEMQSFAERLAARQGTRPTDFGPLYKAKEDLDRKLFNS